MSYTLEEITDAIKSIAAEDLAEEYDNVGLMTGGLSEKIKKVGIALDVTSNIAHSAVDTGCDLLITHHPLIFPSINRILPGSPLYILIKNNIDCYSSHTNFDHAVMVRIAAEKLGALPENCTLAEAASLVKSVFSLKAVLYYGAPQTIINKTMILPGSGMSMVKDVKKAGANLLITGDIKHHQALDALEMGIVLIDAGHFGTEKIFIEYISDYLKKKFDQLEIVSFLKEEEEILGMA